MLPPMARLIGNLNPARVVVSIRHISNQAFVVIPADVIRASQGSDRGKIQKISLSMKAYLETVQQRREFIEKEREEFSLGKRHLANIMGLDPERITQDDIDVGRICLHVDRLVLFIIFSFVLEIN